MTDLLACLDPLTPKRFEVAPARTDTKTLKPYLAGGDSPDRKRREIERGKPELTIDGATTRLTVGE